MHKAIIFDLGRVIVPFDFSRGYEAMAKVCSLEPEEIRNRIFASDLIVPFETGQISASEFSNRLCAMLEAEMAYEDFCGTWNAIFDQRTLIPEELVTGLRKRYRIVLLSNTNAIHFPFIRDNYPILDHFDHLVVSHEVGAVKPDPRAYAAAVERAGCEAHECFFTDDIEAYVEGAKQVGIDAVQFQDADQLKEEFRIRGIQWE